MNFERTGCLGPPVTFMSLKLADTSWCSSCLSVDTCAGWPCPEVFSSLASLHSFLLGLLILWQSVLASAPGPSCCTPSLNVKFLRNQRCPSLSSPPPSSVEICPFSPSFNSHLSAYNSHLCFQFKGLSGQQWRAQALKETARFSMLVLPLLPQCTKLSNGDYK